MFGTRTVIGLMVLAMLGLTATYGEPTEPQTTAMPRHALLKGDPATAEVDAERPDAPDLPPADAPLPPAAGAVELTQAPGQLVEGETIAVSWTASRGIVETEVLGWAEKLKFSGRSRGGDRFVLQSRRPVGDGSVRWQVPWIDSIAMTIKVNGYDAAGEIVSQAMVLVPYRPKAMADKLADGIYVHLTGSHGQRLYRQQDGVIVFGAICSGSSTKNVVPATRHPRGPHDHHGVFAVKSKAVDHYSSLNSAWRMRYAMHFCNGHAIHATSPNMYRYLGRPASHGCVRLHLTDAKALFAASQVGTRVEVF